MDPLKTEIGKSGDPDLEQLRNNDGWEVVDVKYRLVKSYQLRVRAGVTVHGLIAEQYALKSDGWDETAMAYDAESKTVNLQATKTCNLNELAELRQQLGTDE